MQGKIIKGIAGFYYVHVADKGIYECKARGIFRKDNQKPLVGDDVMMEELDEPGKGIIVRILERRSQLIRPAVANVDQAMIIFAIAKPQPSFNLLDRFLVMMKQQNLPCIICFNKLDLDEKQKVKEYLHIYKMSGCQTIAVSAKTGEGLDELYGLLKGHTTTVAGPSGVGKSSLINCLQSGVVMETGDISHKIERGKHTTRHSELIAFGEASDGKASYILDTPGFSSLGLFDLEKEDLADFYPEFAHYEKACRFGGCAHVAEPDCGVKQALREGKISRIRYDNYCLLYEELKNQKRF